MKRIDATIQINKINAVTDAINDIVGGFTVMEGNGRGTGKRQTIRSGRGTGTVTAEFNKVVIITTIVDDSEVENVSKAIADASFTGEEGDGIIAVSNIESVLNIASKKKDSDAL
jgi:nitrogen regulatory protein P-II 1